MDYLNYGKQVQQQPQPQPQQKPQPQGFIDIQQKNKEEPQPQPQGFGQQKVRLTENDFAFGDLNHKKQELPKDLKDLTSQQVNNNKIEYQNNFSNSNPETLEKKTEVMGLFPIPLSISHYPYNYDEEYLWMNRLETRNNTKEVEFGDPDAGKKPAPIHNEQSVNTFLLDDPIMKNVRKFIQEQVDEFASEVMGLSSKMVITQSWFNRNKKGMQHHEHMHPNSIISGVWYPQINEQLPPIKFRNSKQAQITGTIVKYNHFNSATFMLPMRKGELLLFPSNLQHSVPTNFSNDVRLSLSFNTWPKGNLGDESSLTYLPLERVL